MNKNEKIKVVKELINKCNNVELKEIKQWFKELSLNEYIGLIDKEIIKRGIV